jgi:hypothetical protein
MTWTFEPDKWTDVPLFVRRNDRNLLTTWKIMVVLRRLAALPAAQKYEYQRFQ